MYCFLGGGLLFWLPLLPQPQYYLTALLVALGGGYGKALITNGAHLNVAYQSQKTKTWLESGMSVGGATRFTFDVFWDGHPAVAYFFVRTAMTRDLREQDTEVRNSLQTPHWRFVLDWKVDLRSKGRVDGQRATELGWR
jgi:hypothetical protein